MQSKNILISGFGGQGIVAAGRAIAYAGMQDEKNVSMLPSYGPEMRGGAANCHVIISNTKIASPVVSKPDVAIIMSAPALDKFEGQVKPGGTIICDSHVVKKTPKRKDINVIEIPATEIAAKISSAKFSNMVMIGVLMKVIGLPSMESMLEAVKDLLPKDKEALLPVEIKALNAGLNFVK